MKKLLAILTAAVLALSAAAFAEAPLTRYTGKCGFTMDYPEELLNVTSSGTTTTFVAKAKEDVMNVSVIAEPTLSDDPTETLVSIMKEYGLDASRGDVRALKTTAGDDLYACAIPSENACTWDVILQADGRQFYVTVYMNNDVKDKYLPVAEAMILSFAADPEGDFSGYEEAEHYEDDAEVDYYSYMIDRFSPALKAVGTAVWEEWDFSRLAENNLSVLLALMESPATHVYFDFIDPLDNGNAQMILFTMPAGDEGGVDLLMLYSRDENGNFTADFVSAERDLYTICGSRDDGYVLREDASNSAFESGIFFRRMNENGKWEITDALICTADADGDPVWYRTGRDGFDVSGCDPITEEEAMAIADSYAPCTDIGGAALLEDFMSYDMELPMYQAE